MPKRPPSKFWPRCRRVIRWCRITLLALVLVLLCVVIYLNRVGLPDFIKEPVLAQMRERGFELEFERLRLRWYQGIVAEGVNLGFAKLTETPQAFADELAIQLDYSDLFRGKVVVDSVQLIHGKYVMPLSVDNDGPREEFVLDNVIAQVRFLPDDRWELDNLEASWLGAKFNFSGTLTNASALAAARKGADDQDKDDLARKARGTVWRRHLIQLIKTIEGMQFGKPPQLSLNFQVDAKNPQQSRLAFRFHAAEADTRWGQLDGVSLIAHLNEVSPSNGVATATVTLQVNNTRTQWGRLREGKLELMAAQSGTNPLPDHITWALTLSEFQSSLASVRGIQLSGETLALTNAPGELQTTLKLASQQAVSPWFESPSGEMIIEATHSFTNLTKAALDLNLQTPKTEWGKAGRIVFSAQVTPNPDPFTPVPERAWWNDLAPFQIAWNARVEKVEAQDHEVGMLNVTGQWRLPRLTLPEIRAELYGGEVIGAAQMNVDTREVSASGHVQFDAQKIETLLNAKGEQWLKQFDWEKPPSINGRLSLQLPAWTNATPDWAAEVLPNLRINGDFAAGHCAFRGVQLVGAEGEFMRSNSVWYLPTLTARRPEGEAKMFFQYDVISKDYYGRVQAEIDPQAAEPALEEKAKRGLAQVSFEKPPKINAEFWGNWFAPEKIGLRGRIESGDFICRGESFTSVSADVAFTNLYLTATNGRIAYHTEQAGIEGLGFDIKEQKIYFTNGFGQMDPLRITRVIGPKTTEAVSPYKFSAPPKIQVNGSLIVHQEELNDMHFQVDGGPFSYWKFTVPQIKGDIHWVTNTLTLTNILASFYEGELRGNFFFQFDENQRHADYRFYTIVTNANLRPLLADVTTSTNRSEGTLNGDLNIVSAHTSDIKTWFGGGHAEMKNGYLWNVPLFSVLSSILNVVSPGLGSSRGGEATADYQVRNGQIVTENMEMKEPVVRLKYRGSVDFEGNLDARVEAEMLRDTWLLGRAVSFALSPITKFFEYRVEGSLGSPKVEPLYLVPRVILMPLHPIRTVRELFTDEPDKEEPKKSDSPPPPQP